MSDPYLEGYNLALEASGLPPSKWPDEDGDEWDLTLTEHSDCAHMLRSVGVVAYALDEHWQDNIEPNMRVLLIDKCHRVAGDLRKNFKVKEALTVLTPLPYRYPSEFLRARMDVSNVGLHDYAEIRELWRICTHAFVTHIAEPTEPTGHPDAERKPKTPPTATLEEVVTAPSPEWVIQSLLARDSLVMLASASTAGKSLLAIDWMMRMVHGMWWLGRKIQPGSVLYLCGEGYGGIGGRLRGWIAANPSALRAKSCHLVFSQSIPTLSTAIGVDVLRLMVLDFKRRFGALPAVIVVDTLSQAFGEGDENDAATVAPAIKALTELRAMFKCSVLILHHIKKEEGPLSLNSVRGSGAFTANVDIVLGIEVVDGVRRLRTLKLKDGEIAPPVEFEIRGQETGRTLMDGVPERTPVIIPAAPREPESGQQATNDQLIYRAIAESADEGRTRSQIATITSIPIKAVYEGISRLLMERTIVKGDGSNPHFYLPANYQKEKP